MQSVKARCRRQPLWRTCGTRLQPSRYVDSQRGDNRKRGCWRHFTRVDAVASVRCGRRGFASRRCPARADDTAVNHKERAATSPWKPVTPRRIPACSGSSPASPWCMSRGPSPYPLRHQRHVHRQQDRVARHGCRGDASRWKTPTCIGYQILFSMGITKGKWSTLTELLATCEGPALRDGGAQAPGD
jgi:hypothetical protein